MKTFIHLLEANWRFDVSSQAANDLNIQKFNKITIVPLASDLKLLKDHLILKAKEALRLLQQDSGNAVAFNNLLETIYCRTILLNRKRPGELQRMLVHTYSSINKKADSYEEFKEAVSETEKILLKNMKRVVIRGKRGRGVPVIFSTDMQYHIEELLKIRNEFLGDENPYLFGKAKTTTTIQGYRVLAKYAKACGAKNPDALTCTRLRKHLATLTQLFNLNENEIEQLSTFMGHTSSVHKNSYRLPDDVYQTAKVAKLLILMEKGKAGTNKGKTLDEIDLEEDLLKNTDMESDDEENELKENLENESSYLNENESSYLNENENSNPTKPEAVQNSPDPAVTAPLPRKNKRILVPWTKEQKKIVKNYFHRHIKNKKPPKRFECEDLKAKHPKLLNNKDWLKMKVFVQNLYTKKN